MIHTKLHEALEHPGDLPGSIAERDALRSDWLSVPHMVLDKAMFHELDWGAVLKSLDAILSVGRMRLPYPRMLVELYGGNRDYRYICALEEHDYPRVAFRVFEWVNEELWPEPMVGHVEFDVLDRPLTEEDVKLNAEMFGEARTANIHEAFKPGETGFKVSCNDATRKDIIPHVARAILLCAMVTNINGVERETIEPTALNKARAKNGKPAIPTHTVVHIGHVYDRAGRRVKHDPSGRKMPVHMRAAHVRWQNHGAIWASAHREEIGVKPGVEEHRHLILVEAVLVNYRDGTDLAVPLPKVVTA